MQDSSDPPSKTNRTGAFSIASLASGRLVPLASALPSSSSETYSALLEAIVRSTDDAIITKNLASIVTSWNPAAASIFGWEAHEMLGHSLLRLVPAHLHHEELEITRKLRAGEHISHFETLRQTRDGSQIRVELTISPLRNARSEVIGAVAIARNVTSQREAERARLELAAIVESSTDAILTCSLDGLVTSWNAAAERLFGYSAGEMLGQPIQTLIPEELHEESTIVTARLLAGHRIEPFESLRLRRDGSRVDVSLSVSAIVDANGQVSAESHIVRDITRLKQLESSLVAAERLAATTQLSSDLAHLVNNPLEALTNLLYLVRQQKDHPSGLLALLDLADAELARVATVTQQLLSSNRLSAADARSNFDRLSETLQTSSG